MNMQKPPRPLIESHDKIKHVFQAPEDVPMSAIVSYWLNSCDQDDHYDLLLGYAKLLDYNILDHKFSTFALVKEFIKLDRIRIHQQIDALSGIESYEKDMMHRSFDGVWFFLKNKLI